MSHETDRHRLVDSLAARNQVTDERVLNALRSVPRHAFIPPDRRAKAYADRPLPIGDGQTISAPHMVGIMAEILDLDRGDRVLEIGTGCGYHAAVTAELVGAENLYSVEYAEPLAARARDRLTEIGYGEVSVRVGDGREGWPEHAPYDGAYFTCAAPTVPDPIPSQLRAGARLLAPVGVDHQRLLEFEVRGEDSIEVDDHGSVRFVRLRG